MRKMFELVLCCSVVWCLGAVGDAAASPVSHDDEQREIRTYAEFKAEVKTVLSSAMSMVAQAARADAARASRAETVIVRPDPSWRFQPTRHLPDLLSGPPWPECVPVSELPADVTPLELVEVTIGCAEAGDYETMARVRYLEYALTWFDYERLEVRSTLFGMLQELRLRYVTRDQRRNARVYEDRIQVAQIENPSFHNEICQEFRAHGTPTYDVDWAIPLLEHYEIVFTPSENTDDDALWDHVLEKYMSCR